ncbi:MAG TPA: hypothetical protein DCY88_04125 [Cyanobacteria bacterium UBA11372]|nr:hypothetical protein [Cyanobacteria bacterium UBA11372]
MICCGFVKRSRTKIVGAGFTDNIRYPLLTYINPPPRDARQKPLPKNGNCRGGFYRQYQIPTFNLYKPAPPRCAPETQFFYK